MASSELPRLLIVIASTRPGRVGLPVGEWFEQAAVAHGGFDVEVADLAKIALPFMDEPKHPRLQQYEHDHTKAWSATVSAADAVVFVSPEYNYGLTAPLKNAIDYLHQEWLHKPLGLVTYGGVSGGTRAAQMIKQVVSPLLMFSTQAAVSIPFVTKFLQDGAIVPNDVMTGAADAMLDELVRLSGALAPLRLA